MESANRKRRLLIIAALFLAIMAVYGVRLVQLQLLLGEEYLAQVESTYTSYSKLTASRGEITDRYGRVLAGNENENCVILEKVYIPDGKMNQTVRDLCLLLEECDTDWIDRLPLVVNDKGISFAEESENAVARLKKFLGLQDYATAENCMDALIDRFDLEEYDQKEQRQIAGVRYEMERTGFSVSTHYTFAEDIDNETLIRLKESSYRIFGLDVVRQPNRVYYSGSILPHVIGTIGPIYAEEAQELLDKGYALNEKVGKSGIESFAEDYLRGKSGLREVVRNKNGVVIADNVVKEPVAGAVVSLTVDSSLQQFVQSALEAEVERIKGKYDFAEDAQGAAVVVLDVNTFEVLAMCTYPNYSIDDYLTNYSSLLEVEYNPLFNRATQGAYRPGSIFKPIVAALAINDGIMSGNSTVFCDHIYDYYPDTKMQCLGWHGDTDAAKALKYSCNIYFYDVGRRLGIEKLSSGSTDYFGIGQKTGIQVGETAGIMSSPVVKEDLQGIPWYPGDTLQAAIGQMDTLVSPLQMAVYTATIANGGVRKNVSIIHEILPADYEGDPLWTNPQTILSIFPDENGSINAVKRGMEQAAVSYGDFKNLGFAVGAKTGSPQITNTTSFGTFVSYAPADDPQIAVAVVGEKMSHGYVLAPLVSQIYDYYFNRRGSMEPVAGDNQIRG